MRQKILRAMMWLLVVVPVGAVAESRPDLRSLLSSTRYRIFTGRLVGVSLPPEPLATPRGRRDAKLLRAISYWLSVEKEYEAGAFAQIAEARLRDVVFRVSSPGDVLFLAFDHRRYFNDRDIEAWTNIALAFAALGNYRDGAEVLEGITGILEGQRSVVSDAAAAGRVRNDAVALRIQYSESRNDLNTLLDALQRADEAVLWNVRPQGDGLQLPGNQPEALFNRGLILERLGLHGPAVESYRRSLEQSADKHWNEETIRRINRISQPSRRERWSSVRGLLEEASRRGNVREVRNLVRLFPQHARVSSEKEFLVSWARATLVGSVDENAKALAIARRIAAARRVLFADSFLADTVQEIDRSIRERDARRVENLARGLLLHDQGTTSAFDQAAEVFDAAGGPMANAARFHAIAARFDAVPIDRSLEQLRKLERGIPRGHLVLRAMIEGAIGDCLAERGELFAALETYTRTQRLFETLGETEAVASLRISAAHTLVLMGRPMDAWQTRLPALRIADASGNSDLVDLVLRYTASDERFNRNGSRGMAIYRSVLPEPQQYASPGAEHRGSLWRTFVPLYSKQVMLDSLSDRPLPETVRNDLRLAQAISLYKRMPKQAEALLSESIDFAEASNRVAMLPYVHFYRAMARCETQRGENLVFDYNAYNEGYVRCDPNREDDAIQDLTYAISLVEASRRNTSRRDLSSLWYRVADDAFSALMKLRWERGEDQAFFALGERRRRPIADGAATGDVELLTAEGVADRLEPGTAVIVFTTSLGNVLATIIEKKRVEMHRLTIYSLHLYFRTRKLHVAIEENRLPDSQSIAENLYELLIQPLGVSSSIRRLVIIADPPLYDVPFASFRDRKSGRYLIEQFELMRAASASEFAQTKQAALPLRSVVTIGDPAFDRKAYPSLSSLPAARAEAISIGRQYPRSRTLTGRKATLQNLAMSAQTADVLHIAAHTAPDLEVNQASSLLLAPSRQHASAFSVGEAAKLRLKKGSVVVVPGCQTGASQGPNGPLGDFAGSFLAAGARNVVATLWDVEDDPSRTFSVLFHRALRRTGSAVTATREAQLAMLHSSNVRVRDPRSWSGFQVHGVGHELSPHPQ